MVRARCSRVAMPLSEGARGMKVWRRRRFAAYADPGPLTPAQVAALRARSERVHSIIVACSLLGSAVLCLVLAALFGWGVEPYQPALVVWCCVASAILFVALGYALKGRELPAVITLFVVSWVSIVMVVAEVSAGLSIESHLFGIAVLSFVLVQRERTLLRIGLASGAIAAYLLCELRWPEGHAGSELDPEIAQQFATGNRIVAGLLIGAALVLTELRHRTMMRMLRGAARYGELRATTDELTGVYNRRPVIAQLAEWSERGRGNYAIALIDLDHFKTINDEYGHDCGDATIRTVANTLREHFRDSDMVSRWGGDEFLVLMPGVRHADLQPILERLRTAVSELETPCAGHSHLVSVSIGAAMGAIGQSPDECIAAADHALYRAKEEGRNRVVTVGTARPTSALGRPEPGESDDGDWSTLPVLRDNL